MANPPCHELMLQQRCALGWMGEAKASFAGGRSGAVRIGVIRSCLCLEAGLGLVLVALFSG